MPVIKGRKSEKEKFAGGLYTTTVEAFIPANGRAIQGATSHCLGQNFSKMFHIEYIDEEGKTKLVWQNRCGTQCGASLFKRTVVRITASLPLVLTSSPHHSPAPLLPHTLLPLPCSWGITTRTIGVCVMVHGDDKGLVLPPRVAPLQAVIVAIVSAKDSEETKAAVSAAAVDAAAALTRAGVRSKVDDRDNYSPGWKFAHWEQKGVPLRIEVGPRDVASGSVTAVRRDTGDKAAIPLGEGFGAAVSSLLDSMQTGMLEAARRERDARVCDVAEWKSFIPSLDKGSMVLAPWCERIGCEEWVKDQTGPKAIAMRAAAPDASEADKAAADEAAKGLTGAAKTLCIPFTQPALAEGTKCFTGCGHDAVSYTLWGRSY